MARKHVYETAEQWTRLFWTKDRIFRKLFDQLDLANTVELACGHGRHDEQCSQLCGTLTLIDIFPAHLDKCRQRLAGRTNIRYVLGNGYDFTGIPDASITAIFSYDAMVHFAPDMMKSYINDAARILAPGGCFLSHHSNYSANPDSPSYGLNPHARNHMSYELLQLFTTAAGLQILESTSLSWGGTKDLDRVSLLLKP